MRKLINSLLITLTVCLTLSSCTTVCEKYYCGKVEHKYDCANSYVECPVPPRPVFKNMSANYHIGGKHNLDILSNDIVQLLMYNEQLINTIGCYKKQTVGAEVIK